MEYQGNLWQEDETAREIKIYFKVAKRPFIRGILLILFFYLLSLISFLTWDQKILNYFSWLIIVIVIVLICFRLIKLRPGEDSQVVTSGVLTGLALGLFHAVLQLIWFRSWWQFVNLIIEPLSLGIVGIVLGIILSKILKIKNKPEVQPVETKTNDETSLKEGE